MQMQAVDDDNIYLCISSWRLFVQVKNNNNILKLYRCRRIAKSPVELQVNLNQYYI